MINTLKDCKKTTLIGQLPDIINSNNDAIKTEFEQIFDSSRNRLIKSVYAPAGSVKSHFGEFVNLACEYITIKNVDSLKNSIQSTVEEIIENSFDASTKEVTNHKLLNETFIDESLEDSGLCHDAGAIVYKEDDGTYMSVKTALDNLYIVTSSIDGSLNDKIEDISTNLDKLLNSYIVLDTSIQMLNSSVNSQNTTINDVSVNLKTLRRDFVTFARATDASIQQLSGAKPKISVQLESENVVQPNRYYDFYKGYEGDIIFKSDPGQELEDIVNEYILRFSIPSDGITIKFSGELWDDLSWENDDNPFEEDFIGYTYEVRIIDGYASYKKYRIIK